MNSMKEKSSKIGNRNALKHGAFSKAFLLADENIEELNELRRKLSKDLKPRGQAEHVYFEMIVTWAWRLLRAGRWIRANKKGDDFEMLTEIEVPARIVGEYDKVVRRLFQFRAMRNMFNFNEREGENGNSHGTIAALPPPRPHNAS
jgi:hypothetical protein